MALGPELLEAAGLGAVGFQDQIQSKDGLERWAISQVLVTHGRVMWLSKIVDGTNQHEGNCDNQHGHR